MAQVSKGAAGEVLAARFLRDKGYTLLTSNYHSRFGEIDIIACDREYIAFVEVKTRQEGALYAPKEAVTRAKQQRILKTAAVYLSRHPTGLQPRFDVIEIVTQRQNPMRALELDHLMGAYEAGGLGSAF
jgi:putative endonuclease